MRVAFTPVPGHGHFNPLVPLARALAEAGHEVRVATSRSFAHVVNEAGFATIVVRPDWSQSEPEKVIPDLPRTPRERSAAIGRFFVREAPRQIAADLEHAFEEWHPDLVIVDPLDAGGTFAAQRAGVPWATINYHDLPGGPLPGMFPSMQADADASGEAMARWDALRRELGLNPNGRAVPEEAGDFLVLDMLPPSLHTLHGRFFHRTSHPLRPEPPHSVGSPPWQSGEETARVLLTMGTVFHTADDALSAAAEGLSRGGWEVVATAPAGTHLASGVRTEPWVALEAALETCDLLVTHGGWGSVIAALRHGVPMLVLPQRADQPRRAFRVASVGAGLYLFPGRVTADAVFAAARELLADPLYRANARRLQREIATMPPATQCVPLLEKLAEERSPLLSPPPWI